MSTLHHLGLERTLQSARQRVGRRYAAHMRDPNPDLLNPLCPIGLIVALGDDDLGDAGSCGGDRGACAAVVDDGGHSWEEGLLVYLAEGQAVGGVVEEGEVGPAAGDDRAAAEGSVDSTMTRLRFSVARMLPNPK